MKAGNGHHFEQSYNAQAAVEIESRLIVGERVSQAPNDKQELVPTLAAIPIAAGTIAAALVDSGFFSAAAVQQIERGEAGTTVYAAIEKTGHHRSGADLEKRSDPASPATDASIPEVMRHRLRTTAGKALYKLRQQTVEPVFGIIKAVLGFRQFRLRGRAKVSLEWTLETGGLRVFGGLGGFAGARQRRRAGRDLVGVDFALAHKGDAFLDDQLGRPDVPEQFRLGLNLDSLLGGDVAVDLAPQHDRIDVEVALDHGVVTQVENPFRADVPIQLSIEGQFAGKLKGAFELDVRVKDVFRVGV
jgi:hypothetical protein